jgi:hypothetical protein
MKLFIRAGRTYTANLAPAGPPSSRVPQFDYSKTLIKNYASIYSAIVLTGLSPACVVVHIA